MVIKVLGCAGAEFPGHNPPGFLLDDQILFDAGSLTNVLDEQAQIKMKNIFITHAHLDHIRGIPFIADNIIIGHWRRRVNLLSIQPVLGAIKKNLLNSSMWPDFTVIPHHRNAVLKLKCLTAGKPTKINAYTITPYKVHHSVPATGYLVEDREGKRLFYTGDTGPSDATWKKLGGKKDRLFDERGLLSQQNGENGYSYRSFDSEAIEQGTIEDRADAWKNPGHPSQTAVSGNHAKRTPATQDQESEGAERW